MKVILTKNQRGFLKETEKKGKAEKKQIILKAQLMQRHSCGELINQNNF